VYGVLHIVLRARARASVYVCVCVHSQVCSNCIYFISKKYHNDNNTYPKLRYDLNTEIGTFALIMIQVRSYLRYVYRV